MYPDPVSSVQSTKPWETCKEKLEQNAKAKGTGRRYLVQDCPKWEAFSQQLAQVERLKAKFIHGCVSFVARWCIFCTVHIYYLRKLQRHPHLPYRYYTCRSESANHQATTDRPKTRFYPKTGCDRAMLTVCRMFKRKLTTVAIAEQLQIPLTPTQTKVCISRIYKVISSVNDKNTLRSMF